MYASGMTRPEAERECERLAREHPDRATHRWIPREGEGGGWGIAKVRLPDGVRLDPLKTTTEAAPRPQQPDDPRQWRDTGGPWIGG